MKKSIRAKRNSWQRKLVTVAVASCFAAEVAHANPLGAVVVNGQVTFNTSGNLLQVTNTPGAIINWRGFSIGANEITKFIQQSASSSVMNRVTGVDPSVILGTLASNGRVFLINPNGITFGAGSQVNTAGLVASTLGLSDGDFLSGRYRFTEVPGAGGIVNQGVITTPTGGSIYLIAPSVSNSGVIRSDNGEIVLAAGNSVELVNPQSPDLRVTITAPDNQAVNVGQIVAQNGSIGIYGGLIRQGGVVNANSAVVGPNGKIVFKATKDITLEAGSSTTANGPSGGNITIQSDTGTTSVSGTVEAKGDAGTGGTIQVLGTQVGLFDGATVNASGQTGGGTVLVGGDYHGSNPLVQNASQSYVGANASISADAISSGNGGKVIVWGNDTTQFYGNITARGGANSGNGGFVETSGGVLDATGTVNTLSPVGLYGTWLLDPHNITVATGGAATLGQVNAFNLTPTADSTIAPATINGAGANVVLQANNDITFTNAVSIAGAGTTLTAQAGRSILVNANIQTNNAAISLTANDTVGHGVVDANRDVGAAVITMATGTTINAGNGNINLTIGTGPTTNFTSGNITLQNLTTTGNIQVTGANSTNNVILQDATVSAGGTLGVTTTGNLSVTAVNAATSLQSVGAQTISANDITLTGGATGTGVNATIIDSGSSTQSVSGHNITLTAGATGINNYARIRQTGTGTQTITATGNLLLTGGGATTADTGDGANIGTSSAAASTFNITGTTTLNGSTGGTDAGTPGTGSGALLGSTAGNTVNIVLNGTGDITLNGGAVANNGSAIGAGFSITAPVTTNVTINGQGNVTLNGGAASGTHIGSPTSQIGGGAIVVNAGLGVAGSIALNVNGATNGKIITTGSVALNAIKTGGQVTEGGSGAQILGNGTTSPSLTVTADAGVTLTGANQVSSVGITNNTSGNVSLTNTAAPLTITGITESGGSVTVNNAGTVIIGGNVAAGSGAVNVVTTGATSNIDGGGGTISSTNATTGITLNAGGGIGIGGAALTNVTGGGLLNLTTNGAAAAGNLNLTESSALKFSAGTGNISTNYVGTGVHSAVLTSTAGPITIAADAGACANLCLNNNLTLITGTGNILLQDTTAVDFGTGTLRLVSAGAVTQTGTGAISGAVAGVIAANAVDLTGASNNFGNVAATTSNSAQAISYKSSGAVTVGSVAAASGFALTNGISTTNGNVTLNTGGTITVSNAISTGTAAGTGVVTLNPTAGGVTATAASITTNSVLLTGAGTFALTNASNDIAKLAANINGNLSYIDANTVAVDTVSAINGITTAGGNVVVAASGTGALNVNQAINTTPASGAPTVGGSVILEAGGAITLVSAGTITTTGAANATATQNGGVGGEIFIHHTNSASPAAITLGGAVASNGGSANPTGATGGAGGVITVLNDNGAIAVNAVLSSNGGAAGTGTLGNGGTIQLTSAGATAPISQTAAITSTGATPGFLKVTSSDSVTLQTAGNDVGTLAANITGAGKTFSYTDTNALILGSVGSAGSLVAPSTASASTAAINGILSSGGTVTVSATDVSATQSITTNNGGAATGGGVNLTATGGNIALAAVSTNGTTNGGAVAATATGGVTANGAVNAGNNTISLTGDSASTGTGGLITVGTGSLTVANNAITLKGSDVTISSAGTSVTAGAAGTVNFFTSKSATETIAVGTATGGNYTVDNTELGKVSAGTLVFGDAAAQVGNITFKGATPTAGQNVTAGQLVSGAGQIIFDDTANTVVALTTGTGNVTLSAGNGGIAATNATNTTAEIASTGTLTMNTSGAIGSSTNRMQFSLASTPTSIVVGQSTKPNSVFLNGLGALNLGAISTNGGAFDVTSVGQVTGSAAINTTSTVAGAGGGVSIVVTGTGGNSLILSAAPITTSGGTNGAGAGFGAGTVSLHTADGAITTGNITAVGGNGSTTGATGGTVTVQVDAATAASRDIVTGAINALGGTGVTGGTGGAVSLKVLGSGAGAGGVNFGGINVTGGAGTTTGGGAGSVTVATLGVNDITLSNTLTVKGGAGPTPGTDGTVSLTAGRDIIFLQGAATGIDAGGVTLNATRAIVGNAAVATDIKSSGTVALNASAGVGTANAIETIAGTVTFTNTTNNVLVTNSLAGGLTVSGTNAGTGAVNITETLGNLTVGGNITTNSGPITLVASGLNKAINSTTNAISTIGGATAGAAVTLQADNMSLVGGTINAGSGLVTLKPTTAATAIQVGATAADVAGTLGLLGTELQTITTSGGITIGDAVNNTGGITVVGAVTGVNLATLTGGTLALQSNSGAINVNAALGTSPVNTSLTTASGNIVFGATGLVDAGTHTVNLTATAGNIQGNAAAFNNVNAATLNLSASSGIGAANAVETTVSALSFANSTGAVQVTNTLAGGVSVSGTNGGTGVVNITETAGNLTVGGNITTNSGPITLVTSAVDKSINSTTSTISTIGGPTAGAAVTLQSDNMSLVGGTINAGTGLVTLKPTSADDKIQIGATAANAIGAGTRTLGLLDIALNTVHSTGGLTIGVGTNTGGIAVAGAVNPTGVTAGTFSLTTGGAITDAAAAAVGTTGTAGLALNAVSGIGNIAGAAPILIGTIGGSLSANNTTSGDLFLRFNQAGTYTLGATGITQSANLGALQIDALTGTSNLVIGGNLTAGVTNNGTIALDASGTITESTGTLSAATVKLGLNGATAVGASGAPILTAASTLNAKSSLGAIWLSNNLNGPTVVNLTANAAGGLLNVQNTGTTSQLTVTSATSSTSSVTLNTTGLLTVNGPVTAGAASIASLTGVGVTNTNTITGPGGVTIDAGVGGTLTNTAGTITNGGAATSTAVTLTADKMVLGATPNAIQGGAGVVTLQQKTNGTAIDIGTGADTGFGLSGAELGTVATTGALRVGNATSGAITISAGVAPAQATTRLTSGAGISGAGTFTGTSLALVAGGAVNVNTAVTNLAASTSTGGITVSNTTAGTLNVTTVDTIVGVNSTGTAIGLTETTGALALLQAVNAGAATVNLTASSTIGQTVAGVITGGLLTTSSATGTNLSTATNAVTSFNGTNSGAGTVNLLDSTATLAVTGITDTTAGGPVTVNNTGGAISVTGALNAGANAVNLTASSTIGQTVAGVITGGLLTTSSATGTNLSTATNAVTSFNATNSGAGTVNLRDSTATLAVTGITDTTAGGPVTVNNTGGAISVTGALNAGANAVNLTASSTIGQTVAGVITGGLLTTSSATGTDLSTATNAVTSFNGTNSGAGTVNLLDSTATLAVTGITDTTAGGPVTVNNTGGAISVTGALNAGANAVNLTASSTIGQTVAGVITGGLLTTSSATGTNLSTATNAVTSFNGTNSGAGTVNLRDSTATLAVTGITDTTAGGPVTVNNTGGAISVTGALNAGANAVNLTASSTIGQTVAGVITGGLLTTSSATGTDLSTATNAVTSFNGTNSGAGTVNLLDSTATLAVTGITDTTAGGPVTVNNTGGAISVTGALNAGANAVNLTASSTIGQTVAGVITGGLLTTSSATGTNLSTATNAVTSFNATNSGAGTVNLRDSTATLAVTGITDTTAGGPVTVNNTGGAISVTGALNAGANAVNLTASSTIGQTVAGVITGGLLTTSSATGTDLSTATNAVTSFNGTNSGAGTVNLLDSTATLAVTGITDTTAGGPVTVNNTGGAISVTGALNAGANAVNLTASSTIGQTVAGVITGGLLTTSSATGTNLSTATNAVTSFNATNSGAGTVNLRDSTATLAVTGITDTTAGGPVTVNNTGGAISVTGALNAGANAVNLTASSTIGQTVAGVITGGLLTTSSATGTDLSTATNAVTSFNGTNSGAGTVNLLDSTATLAVTGITDTTAGGPVTVNNTGGAISVTGALNAGANAVNLTASSTIGQTVAGVITGGLLTTSSATGTNLSTATNAVTSFNGTNSGAGTVNLLDSTATLAVTGITDTTAGGPVTVNNTGGAISVTGALNAGANAVNLTASSTIGQTVAGVITGGLLTTSSATGTNLSTATNAVTSFNATNTTSGNIALTNSVNPLTISGINETGGSVTVGNTGVINITGTVAAAGGGAVNLTASGAAGAINETGAGLINTTGLLTTSSLAGTTLSGAGANTIGSFTASNTGPGTSGPILLTNTSSTLTVTGVTQAANGNINLKNTGVLATTGLIAANGGGDLELQGSGGIQLGANLTAVGSSTVTLTDAVTLTVPTVTVAGGTGGIAFEGAVIGGGNALVANSAGNTIFSGPVTGLSTLTTDNAGTGFTQFGGGTVQTTGTQTYGDAVRLNANTAFTGTGISFNNTVDSINSNFALTVNDSGTTTFANTVGSILPLASILMNGPGTTAINTTSVTTTGGQIYGAPVTLGAGSVTTLTSNGAGNIQFSNTLNGPQALTVNTSGVTIFNGAVGGISTLTALTTDLGGSTQVNGGLVKTTGSQTYGDGVTTGIATTFNATNTSATIAFNSTLGAGANALTISADEIDFTGAVTGTSTLLLQPNSSTAAIFIGDVANNPVHPFGLDLTQADINAFTNGGWTPSTVAPPVTASSAFPITIGQPPVIGVPGTGGAHFITIGTATFQNPVKFEAPLGGFSVTGTLTGPTFAFDSLGTIVPGGSIVGSPFNGSSLTIIKSGGIGAIGNPLQTNVNFLSALNTTSGDININNAGNVTLVGQFSNTAPGGEIRLSTVNGSIDTSSVPVTSANGRIALIANSAGALGSINVGAGGVNSGSGQIDLYAANAITVNGAITTNSGNVAMIAGIGPGIDTADLNATGFAANDPRRTFTGTGNPPAATGPTQYAGSISLNAPVDPGANGNIVLVSTGPAGIVQNAAGVLGPAAGGGTGSLTAVTLYDAGAPITLGSGPVAFQNTISSVNLFTCLSAGCPDTIPTSSFTGGHLIATPISPFDTAPMISVLGGHNTPLAPPSVVFAPGNIKYTSTPTTGTTIAGVGTAADFTFFTPTSVNFTAPTVAATNLTIEAQGNITFTGFAGLSNTSIHNGLPGGSLNFIAGSTTAGQGNIVYNPLGSGSIGSPGLPFDHTLTFSASNNVTLQGAVYFGSSSTFIVSANTPQSMNSGTVFTPASGTGSVVLSGNYDVHTLGSVAMSGIDFTMTGGSTGGTNQSALGENIQATNAVNLNFTGNMALTAGAAVPAGSASGALIDAATINIGSAGSRPLSLALTGGTSNVNTATSQLADAHIIATGGLNVFVGTGGLNLTAGSATTGAGAGTTGTAGADAMLKGVGTMVLDVLGNATLLAGTANASAGLAGSLQQISADASATIISGGPFAPKIGGSLTMTGGTATAPASNAHAVAKAELRGGASLNLQAGTGITLQGGTANATGAGTGDCVSGTGVCATAVALITSDLPDQKIVVSNGKFMITGGSATAGGGSTAANALAGVDPVSTTTLATTLTVITSAGTFMNGGSGSTTVRAATGVAPGLASGAAVMFSPGSIVITGGLTLNGGPGSGLFQNIALIPGSFRSLDGSSIPITVSNGFFGGCTSACFGDAAFILSGAPPNNLDPLLAGLLSAIESSKGGRFNLTLNLQGDKDKDKNYCK